MDKTLVYHLMHGCILCTLFVLQLARFLALAWLYFAFLRSERWNESSINQHDIHFVLYGYICAVAILTLNKWRESC